MKLRDVIEAHKWSKKDGRNLKTGNTDYRGFLKLR